MNNIDGGNEAQANDDFYKTLLESTKAIRWRKVAGIRLLSHKKYWIRPINHRLSFCTVSQPLQCYNTPKYGHY